jgi:DNA-binding NarL/FixJ family response regulator
MLTEKLSNGFIEEYYFTNPQTDHDIVIFDTRDKIDFLKNEFGQSKYICLDLGLKESDLACLLYCHGIHGILSSSLSFELFLKALHKVHAGEIWVEQNHMKALLSQRQALPSRGKFRELSEQDGKILRLVANGKKNKQIADVLCLSEATIKAHLSRIYKTLNVPNRSSLVALVTESGWTDLDTPT